MKKDGTEETTQHIFGECDFFWEIRRELTGQTLLSVPFEVTGAGAPSAPSSIVRTKLRQQTRKLWNKMWQNNHPCRQTKHFFPTIDKRRAASLTMSCRLHFSAIVQFVTGHNFLKRHEALVFAAQAEMDEGEADDALDKTCSYCEKRWYRGDHSTYLW